MAVASKSQDKTGFVKKFLQNNPQGNVKAVNEAWAGARMTGTIGATLINKLRSQMGLSGNLRAKPTSRTAAKARVRHQNFQISQAKVRDETVQVSQHPSGQVDVRQGVSSRQSPRQRCCGERGVAGCRIRRDHQDATVVKTMRASMGLTVHLGADTTEIQDIRHR